MIMKASAWIGLVLALMVGCASRPPVEPEPIDRQLEQLNASGRAAFESGNYQLASQVFGRALQRAYVRDDAASASDAAYNGAASLSRRRAFEPALALLDEARLIAPGASGDRLTTIDLLAVAILLELERYDDADQLLVESLARANMAADARRSLLLYQLDLAVRRGERDLADQRIAAIADSDQSGPGELMIRARYSRMQGDYPAAAEKFNQAADIYREMIHYAAMAKSLADAADARSEAKDHAAAADLWLRAARSAQLQGYDDWADTWAGQARAAAAVAGEAHIKDRIQNWTDRNRGDRAE